MDMELLHGYGGGSKVTDDIFRVYQAEVGETLNVNDVVEFSNNRVKKTKVTSISGNATPQTLTGMSSSYSGHYTIPYGKDKGILAVSDGGLAMRICTYQVTGATVNYSTVVTPNVSGQIYDMKFIDNNTIAVLVIGGSSSYVNNTVNHWLCFFNLNGDILTFLGCKNLGIGYYSLCTAKFCVVAPREIVILHYFYNVDSSLGYIKGFHCSIDSNLNLKLGTSTTFYGTGNAITSEMSFIYTATGRFIAIYSTYTIAKIFEFKLNNDKTLTLVQDTGTSLTGSWLYGNKLFEINDNLIMAVTIANNNDSYGFAIVIDISNFTLGTRVNVIPTTSAQSSSSIQPDYLNKNKVLLMYRYTNSRIFNSFLLKANTDKTISILQNKTNVITVPDVTNYTYVQYPLMCYLDRNKILVPYANGSAVASVFLVSTNNDNVTTAITKSTSPIGVVKSVAEGKVNVALKNTILKGFKNLLPTNDYYCDENGSITTQASNGLVKNEQIGKAISSTELFLYNLNTFSDFNLGSYNSTKRKYNITGSVTVGKTVKLNTDGTISDYNGTGIPLGLYLGDGIVLLKGIAKGLSGIMAGTKYYFDQYGNLTQANLGVKYLVGYGLSETEVLIPDYIIRKF